VLITTHVASGALLGRALGRPGPALVLGVASHFALDRLPHWGVSGGLRGRVLKVAVVDGLVGLGLIAGISAVTAPERRPAVLAGVTGACLPDLDKPGALFFGRSPYPAWLDAWHGAIQREAAHRFAREVAVAALSLATALGVLRRS